MNDVIKDDFESELLNEKYSYDDNEINFSFRREKDSYAVERYIGESNRVQIPESYLGLPVSRIDSYAFYDCKELVELRIPDSITDICSMAIGNCPRLVYNEYGNAYYLGNSENSFYALIFADKSASECKIHPRTKIIANNAFDSSVASDIVIPPSIIRIGDEAFSASRKLKSLVIPSGVKVIGFRAFEFCDELDEVIIEDGVECFGFAAFCSCKKLKTLIIPDTINRFEGAFLSENESLRLNEYKNGYYFGSKSNPYFIFVKPASKKIDTIEINSRTKFIDSRAFFECARLKSITLPTELIGIGYSAFEGCRNLKKIILPKELKEVFWNAFKGCGHLSICCEMEALPEGWSEIWNSSGCPVIWGYKG